MKYLTFLVSTLFITASVQEEQQLPEDTESLPVSSTEILPENKECIDEETGKKYTLQCNNQSLVVDEYLKFTWSTDKVMTYDLLGLVEVPYNQKDDYSVPVIHGHFELNGFPDEIEVTQNSSFRFCMQFWKNINSDGNVNTEWKDSETSQRHRLRFFNGKQSDFEFYPQLALAKDGLTPTDGKNPDWELIEANNQNYYRDRIDKWCYSAFEDPEGTTYLVPNADTEAKNDTTGIAVASSVIDLAQKKVHLTFFRPLNSTSEYDGDFKENTEYGVKINWGIFDTADDQASSKVRGMGVRGMPDFEKMMIMSAQKATTLIASFLTIASTFAFSY